MMNSITELLSNWGQRSREQIVNNMKKNDQIVTGKTKDSLKSIVKKQSDTRTTLEISGAKYFRTLEKGRKPGKRPPIEPLREWAIARGLPKGIEWAIQAKIAKFGTKLYQQGGRENVYTNVFTDKNVNDLENLITEVQLQTVITPLTNVFKRNPKA